MTKTVEPRSFGLVNCKTVSSVPVIDRVVTSNSRLISAFVLSRSPSTFEKFRHFRLLLNAVYSVQLPSVEFDDDEKKVKEFCGGLLEPCVPHPWKSHLRRLPLSKRISISASVFLFRKVLPAPMPKTAERDYAVRMSTPQPRADADFIDFVNREVPRLFPLGWDVGYQQVVSTLSLKTSSTLENSRKKGGGRGWALEVGREVRENLVDWLKGLYRRVLPARVIVGRALTAGKTRIVTKSSAWSGALSPVHRAVSDCLLKNKHFVRGEVGSYVSSFQSREGEVFVSGDYESATDNLNSEVSCAILRRILLNSTHIPDSVKEECMRTLSVTLVVGKEEFQLRRGQLMGSYLSFPLLSLTNYLAFRYLVPRKEVPVLINGDDIVFRATETEAAVWAKGVELAGLKLSAGKTLVKHSWFSLNSTFFQATPRTVRMVPVIRSTSLYRKTECADSISGSLRSVCSGMRGESKKIVLSEALRLKAPAISATQRSVTRGLGATINKETMERAGLWDRERFYLSLPDCVDPPLPATKKTWSQNCVPVGWRRERSTQKVDEEPFFTEMVNLSWTSRPRTGDITTDYWDSLREGTFRYNPSCRKKTVKLSVKMGLYPSNRQAWQAVREQHENRVTSCFVTKGKMVWVKCPERDVELAVESCGPWPDVAPPWRGCPDWVKLDFAADCLRRMGEMERRGAGVDLV